MNESVCDLYKNGLSKCTLIIYITYIKYIYIYINSIKQIIYHATYVEFAAINVNQHPLLRNVANETKSHIFILLISITCICFNNNKIKILSKHKNINKDTKIKKY